MPAPNVVYEKDQRITSPSMTNIDCSSEERGKYVYIYIYMFCLGWAIIHHITIIYVATNRIANITSNNYIYSEHLQKFCKLHQTNKYLLLF